MWSAIAAIVVAILEGLWGIMRPKPKGIDRVKDDQVRAALDRPADPDELIDRLRRGGF